MHFVIKCLFVFCFVLGVQSAAIDGRTQPLEKSNEEVVDESGVKTMDSRTVERLVQRLERLEAEMWTKNWEMLLLSVLVVVSLVLTLALNLANFCLTEAVVKSNDNLKSTAIDSNSLFVRWVRSKETKH